MDLFRSLLFFVLGLGFTFSVSAETLVVTREFERDLGSPLWQEAWNVPMGYYMPDKEIVYAEFECRHESGSFLSLSNFGNAECSAHAGMTNFLKLKMRKVRFTILNMDQTETLDADLDIGETEDKEFHNTAVFYAEITSPRALAKLNAGLTTRHLPLRFKSDVYNWTESNCGVLSTLAVHESGVRCRATFHIEFQR